MKTLNMNNPLSILASFTFYLGLLAVSSAQHVIKPGGEPKAKITAKVIDENGKPIENAEIGVDFFVAIPWGSGAGTKALTHRGLTQVDGTFIASDRCGMSVGMGASKRGYYRTYGPRFLFKEVKNGEWQPWNPTIDLVLKPILNPIPLYVKKVEAAMPAFNQPIPYDLTAGDWVAPFGKGSRRDLIFTAKLDQRSENDYNYSLTVSFDNPKDGIQIFDAPFNAGSELRSPHAAPENGYLPQWDQTRSRKPDQVEQGNYASDGNRNYFIRVRTVVDEKGQIVSAHYGKIYGEFLNFTYYFNPAPNDRNLEFDPKRNLFGNLPATQRVSEP